MKEKGKMYSGQSEIKTTVITDVPEPPPSEFISPFKTIEEWLSHICDTNHPEGNISECHITLIESSWNNVLDLEGWNETIVNENTIAHRIVFKPISHKYFPLPKDKFANLSQQEVKEQVMNELIAFTKSAKFKNSFLSKIPSIQTNIGGQIWAR